MPAVISLRDVVNELESIGDQIHAYLNVRTGETYTVIDDMNEVAEDIDEDELAALPQWQRDDHAKRCEIQDSDDWKALPGKHDINEWQFLQDFAEEQTDTRIQDELLDAIRGSGAFRRFRRLIDRFGIEEKWYHHRAEQLKQVAIDWLEANDLKYIDDIKPRP